MSDQPPQPAGPPEAPNQHITPEEYAEVVKQAQELSQEMIMQSVEKSTAVALLAAESFIAYRTAGARMPLQEVMNNLLQNVPSMYVSALQAEAGQDIYKGEEGGEEK